MSAAVTVLVALGVALALALGARAGLDVLGAVLLAAIVAFGALVVAVARRARGGRVMPARCSECDGLVSPNAPYCKHCGSARGERAG